MVTQRLQRQVGFNVCNLQATIKTTFYCYEVFMAQKNFWMVISAQSESIFNDLPIFSGIHQDPRTTCLLTCLISYIKDTSQESLRP